ncbi:MAG: hypothetical protein KBT34_13785 [Prevotella sp.]|nr:hypothetical protein [Candidatus Prevotella equi]
MQGKILSKAPCNDDLFEGGAHKKLAGVIAGEIRNDSNCTIIGIDGGWGSGKSNLVGMVKENLCSGSEKYHFFTYDAWGHQTDLQRRTILEELITDLVDGEMPVFNEESWRISLDNLLAKKKYTSTKTVPAIGKGTIVSLFALILTPFVSHLASLVDSDWLKALILIIPYVLAYGVVMRRHYHDMKEKHGQTLTWETVLSEFFLVYKDSIKEETRSESISEKEPSSRQFKEWIHKIDKGLKDNNDTIVVFVIDNMDRLPKLKVQELWAAIHSCFAEERYSNIRVIVPFDRSHIRNAFQSEDIKTSQEEIVVYGDDFINKTFYVVYSVPPPIMTDWMHYFCDRWKEAFGEYAKVDNSVLQIYDMLTKEHSPRKIIAFINQFVTIRNLCDESIEDKYIALFIFGRKIITEKPLEEILNPTYLGSLEFLYSEDDRMKACISSLYYQLPVENAMDVIFTREAMLDLDDGKTDILEKLKPTEKYWEILNHSITKVTNIENATMALDKHFGDDKSKEASQVWEALYRKSNPGSAVQDKYYHGYHSILLQKIEDKANYYQHLLRVYHANITEDLDLTNYLDGIDKLRESLGDIKDIYMAEYNTEVTPELYLQLLIERGREHSVYGLSVDVEKFDEYVAGIDLDEISNKSFYQYVEDDMDLPKYKEKIKELFKKNVSSATTEVALLKRIKEIEERPFDINSYITDSQIYNFCASLTEKDALYADAIAMLIARYEYDRDLQNYYNSHADGFSEEFVEKVAESIQYYMDYDSLLLKIGKDTFNHPKFVSLVAKELTIGSYGSCRMSVKDVLMNFDKILLKTEIASELLLKKWSRWSKYFNTVEVEDVKSLPLILVEECTKTDNELTRYILSLAQDFLSTVEQQTWKQSLLKDDYNWKLLKIYHPKLLPFFVDAFKECLRNYATGETTEKMPSAIVNEVIAILKEQSYDLKGVFREVRDVFINNANINKDKLKYFGKWLFEFGRLQDKQESLNKIFRSEFLDDNDVVTLLLQYKDSTIGMVVKSRDNIDFINKIDALHKTKYKDNEEFVSLYNALQQK